LSNSKRTIGAIVAMLLSLTTVLLAEQDDRLQSDASSVIEALALTSGSTVADIGAAEGQLSLILARHVGPQGRVYATDLNRDRLDGIRRAADTEKLTNVSVVEGHETRTNLPAACCDGLVVRFVYHHFGNPPAMNASMRDSLRPGGRVAVIDFSPRESESNTPGGRATGAQHGVTPETVIRELTAAGFRLISTERGPEDRVFMVVVQRPPPP
jgi:ubiquinone/menaquinone biosynthesis C-methylase UbiE